MSHLPPHLAQVVEKLRAGLKELYGNRFCGLLLYGSYARGDFREGSDIDLLLLLDGPVNTVEEIIRLEPVKWPLSLANDVVPLGHAGQFSSLSARADQLSARGQPRGRPSSMTIGLLLEKAVVYSIEIASCSFSSSIFASATFLRNSATSSANSLLKSVKVLRAAASVYSR